MSEKLKKAFTAKNKFDELNEKGVVRISEKSGTPGPDHIRISGKPEAPIVDHQLVKGAAPRVERTYTKVKGHTSGKLGALAALGTLGYQALKGEPVMAKDAFKAGAEAFNPYPVSMEEMSKVNPKKKLEELLDEKEARRVANEERAAAGALAFGKKLAEMQKKKNRKKDNEDQNFASKIAPLLGTIYIKPGLVNKSGKPITTMDDVVEYAKENKPLYHSTSKKRAEAIHESGLIPEVSSGAIESYGYSPESLANLTDDELQEIPEAIRNKSYTPVSWMAEEPSLGYSGAAISKEKKGNALIGGASSEELQKLAGVNIIPRSEDIYWNSGRSNKGALDLRASADKTLKITDYDEALDLNPYIESGDFISERVQNPDITLTDKDAVEFVKKAYPQDEEFIKKFATELKSSKKSLKGSKAKSGSGKLGAAIAIGTLGYQALKGEPVMAQDVIKAGSELLNPLPFDMGEIKSEFDKMDSKKKLDDLIRNRELGRKIREEKSIAGALEFGKTFTESLKKGEIQDDGSPRFRAAMLSLKKR